MSLSWQQRKARLALLLKSRGDEDVDGVALDRLMHGQSVIGRTSKTTEIESLRFQDKDLDVVGTLEYGQFGVIDVVTCHLDNCVYVRKSIEKRFALKTRDQCSPQFERDILLQAIKTDTPWAPHLLCAFQTPTHLNVVMDYAEGGTLWDVLESSPHDGKILEKDLRWWVPQIVSAIHWCHSQGFAHRDIKPHNFVLTPDAHVLLIDFGSAAPLLPPNPDGSQLIPKRYCLVPCGTCDYISPEILQSHEEALVALEMESDDSQNLSRPANGKESESYGVETDWWSLGAMLYEMAYGVAPFFASDIRQTYVRIMNHEKSLRFDQKAQISHEYQHFLRRLLTHAKQRLGRRNVMEITDHPLFDGVDWVTLPHQTAPSDLHLPQFTYIQPEPKAAADHLDPGQETNPNESSHSQGFAFSAFFQQSSSVSPGLSILRPSPGENLHASTGSGGAYGAASFIGFSWGPTLDAFPPQVQDPVQFDRRMEEDLHATPRALIPSFMHRTPLPALALPTPKHTGGDLLSTPQPLSKTQLYTTPLRPYALSPYITSTIRRPSTILRTAPKRTVSDREAMKQLVDCVGMSARKKVMESGRKPRVLTGEFTRTGTGSGTSRMRKELRFDPTATPIPGPDYSAASSTRSTRRGSLTSQSNHDRFNDDNDSSYDPRAPLGSGADVHYPSSESTDSESNGPPSPSPSPRPGSAMSMMSISRRSGTPTFSMQLTATTGTFSGRIGAGVGMGVGNSSAVTGGNATGSALLSIPSASAMNLDFRLGPLPGAAGAAGVTDGGSRPAAPVKTQLQPQPKPQPKSTRIRPRIQTKLRSSSYDGEERHQGPESSLVWLTELERRHAVIMRDIEELEERFEEVNFLIER
ncbi:kinase-like domain-containing protein [Crassisporium funariophilum]|nr:kinase-like domain-containing protein [Crassisporium funariophilum]